MHAAVSGGSRAVHQALAGHFRTFDIACQIADNRGYLLALAAC